MLEYGIQLLNGGGSYDQALKPVLEAVVVLGSLAIGLGVCVARSLTRRMVGIIGEDAAARCRRHDWLRSDNGGYVCVRCNYRAGS